MTFGLLQCDHVQPEFLGIAGDYDAMFRALFAAHAPEVKLRVFDLRAGDFPENPSLCDAWITSGSAASVYEDEAWLHRFAALVRDIRAAGTPYIGICFGHQMLAHALGGRVACSPRGWGVGAKEVKLSAQNRPAWIDPPLDSYRLLLSHQDQVEELPPGGRTLGGNAHCPNSMIAVGSSMIGFQGHPEYPAGYAKALMLSRRDRIPPAIIDAALPTFDTPPDTAAVMSWILRFARDRRHCHGSAAR